MRAFRIGCYLAFFTAALHMVGAHLMPPPAPTTDAERQMLELMQTTALNLPGAPTHTMYDLMQGFSLLMSLNLALAGGLGLIIARRAAGDTLLLSAAARTLAGANIVALVISLMHFFIVPTLCTAAIALAFTIASFRPGNDR